MTFPAYRRALASATIALALGGCDSFDVEDQQFAIISVPTTVVEGGGYSIRPTAFFFQGIGVRLSSTQVGNQGCVIQPLEAPGVEAFQDIDAGDAITVSAGEDDGVLSPSAVGTRTLYQLPSGQSIPLDPGERITLTIPGAAGGFPARIVSAFTVENFTPEAATLPVSTTARMDLAWSPASTNQGTAMFYSLQYSSTGAMIDREIACVFADDGTGFVDPSLLNGFRESDARMIFAQRALITVERVGTAITHVTSSLTKPVPFVVAE